VLRVSVGNVYVHLGFVRQAQFRNPVMKGENGVCSGKEKHFSGEIGGRGHHKAFVLCSTSRILSGQLIHLS